MRPQLLLRRNYYCAHTLTTSIPEIPLSLIPSELFPFIFSRIKIPRPAYKPHSVRTGSPCADGHLSRPQVSLRLERPTRSYGSNDPKDHYLPGASSTLTPAWPCSWWGLPGRKHCCLRRWSLTPPFHPYSRPSSPLPMGEGPGVRERFISVARSGRDGSLSHLRPGCYPAPCSVECGLSSESISRPATHPADLG